MEGWEKAWELKVRIKNRPQKEQRKGRIELREEEKNVKIHVSNIAFPRTLDLWSDTFGKHCVLSNYPYLLQFIMQNSLLMALRRAPI